MVFRRLLSSAFAGRAATFQKLRNDLIESQLFDADFYRQSYPDVRASGVDPATHYIRYGGLEGRQPSVHFDAAFYLGTNTDVRDAKVNPLIHYIKHGKAEGRAMRPLPNDAPPAVAPSASAWDELAAQFEKQAKQTSTVDIIIPVYSGHDETANCLYTVLQSRINAPLGAEIVVIDDCGPEPELSRLVDKLAARGLITLVRNEKNLGFVASVNRGMALHPTRDVILLNADTEVYGDWVERLRRAACSDDRIGTVTPFANNATICSYPFFPKDFRGALEVSFGALDRLASEANRGLTADILTGVGFCIYIKRTCLDQLGLFDEKAFGPGYGEETDFCQRAAAQGWRNVIAGDIFVRHWGCVSFGSATYDLGGRALRVLGERYPSYVADEAKFVETDPLKRLRLNIDIARIRKAAGNRSILHVVHHPYGGTLKHVYELSQMLAKEGVGSLLLRPWPGDARFAELSHAAVHHLSVANKIDITGDFAVTAQLLRDLGVFSIHVHHYMGFAPDIMDFVQAVSESAGISYDFTMHDYLPVCPRITMIDSSGIYCGKSDLATCQRCIDKNGTIFGKVDIAKWRTRNARFLDHARRVFVPNEDLVPRLKQFLPAIEFTLRPHTERVPETLAEPVPRRPGEVLRVAVIGVIAANKGSHHLVRFAQDAARRRLPIEFNLFGFDSSIPVPQIPTINARAAGRYAEADLLKMLAEARCHLSFFPAVWPETYCYALSQAIFAGLFPVAFDIGAIAQRIRAMGWGQVLPFSMLSRPSDVNDALLAVETSPPQTDLRSKIGKPNYPNMISDYYGFDRTGA